MSRHHINKNGVSHEKIKLRLIAAKKSYFDVVPLFKSKMLSLKMKITPFKVLVRLKALYTCGALAIKKSDQNKLATFEQKVLGMFGSKRETLKGNLS